MTFIVVCGGGRNPWDREFLYIHAFSIELCLKNPFNLIHLPGGKFGDSLDLRILG